MKVIEPENPALVTTLMFEAVVPPGAIASGENGFAVSVKSACAAAGKVKKIANRHRTGMPVQSLNLETDPWDLNMSWCGFN